MPQTPETPSTRGRATIRTPGSGDASRSPSWSPERTPDVRPTTGAPLTTSPWSSGLWEECRDHIWCSRDMRATAALPPPAPESMRGLPSLHWPSDHIALCADLEWTAEEQIPKRQKSDPGRPPAAAPKPHEQRSWGETSLKRALP